MAGRTLKRPAAARPAAAAGRPRKRPASASASAAAAAAAGRPKKRPASASAAASAAAAAPPPEELGLPRAWVVNLARRPDRWRDFRAHFGDVARAGAPQLLELERVDAVDGAGGAEIPADAVALTWSTARNWRYVTRSFEGGEQCGYEACELPLTGGERGCAASHVALWRRCAAEAAGPALILEDDALPQPGYLQRLRAALGELRGEDPDLLYLGYTQAAPWRRRVGKLVREAEYVWTTVGYMLWPRGARRLLAALPVDQPVDNFMSDLISRRELRAFVIAPPVLEQAKPWNVDNDVKHSDDQAWVQNRRRGAA